MEIEAGRVGVGREKGKGEVVVMLEKCIIEKKQISIIQ